MAPTNIYIDNFNNNPEQKLIESLIVESIKFNGKDFYYLPRKASTQFDTVYGEDPGKFYDEAHLIEMYVQNVEGWGGERDTITNFGLEIREEMTLIVAMRRFNDLLSVMRRNLDLLDKAIQGTVVMSMDLESMAASFLDGKVPMKFEAPLGYPSLKPLGSWVTDLVLRVEFLSKWLYEGAPSSYWLSAFFFPQGFMTAAL